MTTVVRFPSRPAVAPAPPASRAGAAWTAEEDAALQRLRRGNLGLRQLNAAVVIVAEDFGRTLPEVCRRFDFLLGPAAVRAGSLTATERALYALAGRAEEDRRATGGFMLDGHPAEWREVARAANAVLMASGAGPIPIPEDGP